MASVVPLRRSLRLAEKQRIRQQQKVAEFQTKFSAQFADLEDRLAQLANIINRDADSAAEWELAVDLARKCEDHCLNIWLSNIAKEPVITPATTAFGKLSYLARQIVCLCKTARVNDEHYCDLAFKYDLFIEGVQSAAKNVLSL